MNVESFASIDLNANSILDDNRVLFDQYPKQIRLLRQKVQHQIRMICGLDISNSPHNPIINDADKSPGAPLVVTGHQVEFFHPGILSKEILGFTLASHLNGACISLVLDHDPHDLIFHCPRIHTHNSLEGIRKASFLLNTKSESKKSLVHKKAWLHFLHQIPENLEEHYKKTAMDFLRENISVLTHNLEKYGTIADYITFSRLESLKKIKCNIYPLKVSELVKLEGWGEFCEFINDHLNKFIEAHNSSLNDYRKQHHIKNHAQPVPNLRDNETPFWVVDDDGIRRKAGLDDIGRRILYPRAVTLSIFVRLFVSDIFIHGTGGARYDQVTNSIIRKFFNVLPSPFLVKTANLQIPLKDSSPLIKFRNIKSLNDWYKRYRFFLFHPDKIKGADPELVKNRFQLIQKFQSARGGRKSIHDDLEANRIEILNTLDNYEDQLFNERDEIKKYSVDRNVLTERGFPYFFYDMNELLSDQGFNIVKYT